MYVFTVRCELAFRTPFHVQTLTVNSFPSLRHCSLIGTLTRLCNDCEIQWLCTAAVIIGCHPRWYCFCHSAQQMSLCRCSGRESIRTYRPWDLGLLSSVTPLFLPHFCRFVVRGSVRKSVPVACNILAKERRTDWIHQANSYAVRTNIMHTFYVRVLI